MAKDLLGDADIHKAAPAAKAAPDPVMVEVECIRTCLFQNLLFKEKRGMRTMVSEQEAEIMKDFFKKV